MSWGRTRAGLVRRIAAALVCLATILAPLCAGAASEVFSGDPIDPETGDAFEILPGNPLIEPGPDGILGTADDVINWAVVGDIDLVVRAGSVSAAPAIPPPTALGGPLAAPTGVAGPTTSGGVAIPFTVFLCGSGCYGENPAAPYGTQLQTLDMDDFPVVVAAFADLDGDGYIGPTPQARSLAPDAAAVQVRELEPVGRAVASFDDGVAHGALAIRAGLPASQGGLRVALVAAASSGPYNAGTYGGLIGAGSGMCTAMPFLPQKDFTRFLRATAEPAGPRTTIYPFIQFAEIPVPGSSPSYALPLDGSSPTIDAAVVYSQPAVRAALREDPGLPTERLAAGDLVFGTRAPVKHRRMRLVPVDRLDNPADPPPGFAATVTVTPPARMVKPGRHGRVKNVTLSSADGRKVVLQVPGTSVSGDSGLVMVEQGGVVVAVHRYAVDARANPTPPDAVVPGAGFPTIQSALDLASDRNGDGVVAIAVRPGVFVGNLVIARPLVLEGAGAERTIVQGDGSGPAVSVVAPNVVVRGITATGGTSGFALDAASPLLAEARGWHNDGSGIAVSGAGAQIWRSEAIDNLGDGLSAQAADGLACEQSKSFLNGGAGVRVASTAGATLEASWIAANTGSGVVVANADLAASGNQVIVNLASGIETSSSNGARLMDNLSATNDGDGLHMAAPNGDVVWGNALDNNGQYGLWLSGPPNADFSPAPGQQAPIGNNTTTANQEGPSNFD